MTIQERNEDLFRYIEAGVTPFHAVAETVRRLEEAGYTEIGGCLGEEMKAGGKYYVRKNSSTVIAMHLPEGPVKGIRISSAHSDNPCFKIKESPEMEVESRYLKLNTEAYGGMIMSTWFDRPLAIAGRVFVNTENGIEEKLVQIDRDLCIIPNLCIHFNREINKGYSYNPQIDLLPLFAGENTTEDGKPANRKGMLMKMLCEEAGIDPETVLGSDLYLYNRDKGRVFGAANEFVGSPRLDDLQSAYGTLMGFLEAEIVDYAAVYCLFDNEEVGSGTKQGADSTVLSDALEAIFDGCGITGADRRALFANSFMLSADNGHALHPNYPERSDPTNRPYLNGGVVLKFQGSQRYATDGYSAAVVRDLCKRNDIPVQNFANRSDTPGGGTLGNISTAHVSIPTADIGLPQLAMHSAFETTGAKDTDALVRLCRCYFSL